MTIAPLPPFSGLPQGATLRVIAPANYVTEADMAPGRTALEAAGFKIDYCADLFAREGQFAGADRTRAASLMRAFSDPTIDGILCARGGYGSPRIMELVDWSVIAANPKPFVGYSDLTAVLARLVHRCGMRAFHGPVMRDLRDGCDPLNLASLTAALRGERTRLKDIPGAVAVRDGDASGRLVGGNLTLLASLMGTGAGFRAEGGILILEDISEYIYRLDRALVQLRQSGALDGVKAVLISELVDVEDGTVPFGKSAIDMIAAHFGDIPIVAGVPAGHSPRKLTWELGAEVNLQVTSSGCSFSQMT